MGQRRRTGCQSCRSRRIKCDEKQPCGYCTRRCLECKRPEFIVNQGWEKPAASSSAQEDSINASDGAPAAVNPSSTYDVFQNFHHHLRTNEPLALSSPGPEPVPSPQPAITEEIAELLLIYQNGIGPWMDVSDRSNSHQLSVVLLALSSPLLLHAICALSAKQMMLIKEPFLWEPLSARHYCKSLDLLIQELAHPQLHREVILAATILLCSYELLATPGSDYQRHLHGARTLIRTYEITPGSTSLEIASFWIYARQDVALALLNESPTLIPPRDWPDVLQQGQGDGDADAKRILWLLARIIECRFTPLLGDEVMQGVSGEIDTWWNCLPPSARGITTTTPLDDGLSKKIFCVPTAASACLHYHLAKILHLECIAERGTSQPSGHLEGIQVHALAIASICLSPDIMDSVLIVAVNPLYYAAKYVRSLFVKTRIWTLLSDIESRLGFHTRNRLTRLQD